MQGSILVVGREETSLTGLLDLRSFGEGLGDEERRGRKTKDITCCTCFYVYLRGFDRIYHSENLVQKSFQDMIISPRLSMSHGVGKRQSDLSRSGYVAS